MYTVQNNVYIYLISNNNEHKAQEDNKMATKNLNIETVERMDGLVDCDAMQTADDCLCDLVHGLACDGFSDEEVAEYLQTKLASIIRKHTAMKNQIVTED